MLRLNIFVHRIKNALPMLSGRGFPPGQYCNSNRIFINNKIPFDRSNGGEPNLKYLSMITNRIFPIFRTTMFGCMPKLFTVQWTESDVKIVQHQGFNWRRYFLGCTANPSHSRETLETEIRFTGVPLENLTAKANVARMQPLRSWPWSRPIVPWVFSKRIFIEDNALNSIIMSLHFTAHCYEKIQAETKLISKQIINELGLDPIDKEVVVLYDGEKGNQVTSRPFE